MTSEEPTTLNRLHERVAAVGWGVLATLVGTASGYLAQTLLPVLFMFSGSRFSDLDRFEHQGLSWYNLSQCVRDITAGLVAAFIARHRRVAHAISAGAILAVVQSTLLSDPESPSTLVLALMAATVGVTFSAFGGLAGIALNKVVSFSRLPAARRSWKFMTATGQEIEVEAARRRPFLAALLVIASVPLCLLGLFVFLTSLIGAESQLGKFGAKLIALGRICLSRARMVLKAPIDRVLSKDERAPIVYLRSFQNDVFPAFWESLEGFGDAPTSEMRLADIFKDLGPLVVIGSPNERVPKPGGYRLYVSHGKWKETVSDLIGKASVVILRTASSPGIRWEFQEVFERIPRSRILILLDFPLGLWWSDRQRLYDSFRTWAEPAIGQSLPTGISDAFLLSFEDDGRVQTYSPIPSGQVRHAIEASSSHHHLALYIQRLEHDNVFARKDPGINWVPVAVGAVLLFVSVTRMPPVYGAVVGLICFCIGIYANVKMTDAYVKYLKRQSIGVARGMQCSDGTELPVPGMRT